MANSTEGAEKAFLGWINSLGVVAEKITNIDRLRDGVFFVTLLNKVYPIAIHGGRDSTYFSTEDYSLKGGGSDWNLYAANLQKLNTRINKYLRGCLNIPVDSDTLDIQAIARDGEKKSIIKLVCRLPDEHGG